MEVPELCTDATTGGDETERAKPETRMAADAVEAALANALTTATRDHRWDLVAQLARELEARRIARAGNVVVLGRSGTREGGAR